MKSAIIRGTFILTATGIISRIIGFYYRIFLSKSIGAEGMGLYQMVFPVASVAFAVCVAGIETAISKFSASQKNSGTTLVSGLLLSSFLSSIFTIMIYFNSDFLASRIFMNTSVAPLIRVLSLSIPLACIHNCINGYYYGMKKTKIPAFSQLCEQFVRVGGVYLIISIFTQNNRPVTSIVAMYGLLLGEFASVIFSVTALTFEKNFRFQLKQSKIFREIKKILRLSIPLSSSRVLLTLFQSGEAILIPAQLMIYGLTNSEALSTYGILTGMALPLIFFPSAITNSVSVLLLPTVSKAQSDNHPAAIAHTISNSIKYSIIMGIFCTGMFITYGGRIGAILFHNDNVNTFVMVLAWLCPFMYITTTLGSILNGLGKTTYTSVNNTICIMIRIAFVIICIPKFGITGYLWGVLASQIYTCSSFIIAIRRLYPIHFNPMENLIMPMISLFICTGLSFLLYHELSRFQILPDIIRLALCGCIAALIYIMFVFKVFRNKAAETA